MYTDLMDAYGKFRSEKNWKNLKNLYKNAFHTPGISVWKLFRFAKNLLTGRYEKLYRNYQRKWETVMDIKDMESKVVDK